MTRNLRAGGVEKGGPLGLARQQFKQIGKPQFQWETLSIK